MTLGSFSKVLEKAVARDVALTTPPTTPNAAADVGAAGDILACSGSSRGSDSSYESGIEDEGADRHGYRLDNPKNTAPTLIKVRKIQTHQVPLFH